MTAMKTTTAMTVDHNYFGSQADVMQDIGKTGFWPTTFVSDESPELPVHYHNYDIIGYVMSGSTYLLDEDSQRITISAGDRLNIPKGAWHAEGAVTDTVTYIVTVSEPVAFMEALTPLEPRGPWPGETPPS
jgi:quercetin dioxygenase-like cupin family protein